MDAAPIWITEAEVTATMALPDAISALEGALAMEADGAAANLPKTHLMVAANDAMHAIGASVAGAGICGTKTWVNVGGKSQTVLVLFSLEDGRLRAVVEATALGQMRTAAMTGVGTARLAPEDARRLALIGTGKQALPNAAACAAVRDIEEIRVFSRRAAGARSARRADRGRARDPGGPRRERGGGGGGRSNRDRDHQRDRALPLRRDARAPAPISTRWGRSFRSASSSRRTCSRAAASSSPSTRWRAYARFRRSSANASPDDDAGWQTVRPISRLIAEDRRRPAGCDLTLFKAVGMGLSDLALGIEVLARAEAGGLGAPLPERVRVAAAAPLTGITAPP